jgi:hypothetical protein
MDAAAIAATAEILTNLWKLGGIVAVLLGCLVMLAGAVFVVSVKAWRALAARCQQVEEDRALILKTCVLEQTIASRDTSSGMRKMCDYQEEMLDVLKARPCLVESQVHRKPSLPDHMHHA